MCNSKHDVIKKLGRFPDRILKSKSMKSKHWKCSKCNKDFKYEEPATNPSPCTDCGSIFFKTENKEKK